MGEATARIAKAMPDVSFLAVEVHKPGVGKLMSQLVENGSENVRIIHGDVYEVITKQLRDQTLDGVHIFFPDPWQKIDEPRLVPFKALSNIKLKSLIMAQIERWRQA